MIKKRALLLLCFSILAATTAFHSDDDPFSELLKKLDAFNQLHPQEKVHLQLDKPYYAIGDDIWFKAYVVDAGSSRLSTLSGVLNVDLINENDSLVKSVKLPVTGGVSWGDFQLADTLMEGNYRIRAYTELMRNAGTTFFFDKTIKVGNSWANKVFVAASYTYDHAKNDPGQVTATLHFSGREEQPIAVADVSYTVSLEDKVVARGKGKTNADGELSLVFRNPRGEALSPAKSLQNFPFRTKRRCAKLFR
jgi:hypothetical protein